MFLCLPVGSSSHRPRFSPSPYFFAVGPCAVPTSSTLDYCCLQEFWVAAYCAPVRDRGDWGVLQSASCRETLIWSHQPGSTRSAHAIERVACGCVLLLCQRLDRCSIRAYSLKTHWLLQHQRLPRVWAACSIIVPMGIHLSGLYHCGNISVPHDPPHATLRCACYRRSALVSVGGYPHKTGARQRCYPDILKELSSPLISKKILR